MGTVMDWSRCHNGLFHCPFKDAYEFMPPEFGVILDSFTEVAELPLEEYVVDVKIHMLKKGMYPCIPNWHFDMVPRGEDGKQDFSKADYSQGMFLWLSGPPFTEFRDGREIKPETWSRFNQSDQHRGVAAEEDCWRGFVRIAPKALVPVAEPHSWIRRHTQVYLDAAKYTW